MPLFGKSETFSDNPEVRDVEKVVAKEARAEQKTLDHAISDLSGADSAHNKSIKAADKAAHALDKAVANEHKTAKAVNRAIQNHETAILDEQNAEKVIQTKKQHETRLEQDLEQRRQNVEELRQRKGLNDQLREERLADLHGREAAAAEARSDYRAGDRANSVGNHANSTSDGASMASLAGSGNTTNYVGTPHTASPTTTAAEGAQA